MQRISVQIDEETAIELAEAVKRDRQSRSAWVSDAIKLHLSQRRREALVESAFDDLEGEEILADIRR